MKTRTLIAVMVTAAMLAGVATVQADVFDTLVVTNSTTLSNLVEVVGNVTVSGYLDANSYGNEAAWGALDSGGSFAGGTYAQRTASNCVGSVVIGWYAQQEAKDAGYATALGYSAQRFGINGWDSVGIGDSAQCWARNFVWTVAVGAGAQGVAYDIPISVGIGYCAQQWASNSAYSVAIGGLAQRFATNSEATVAVGYCAQTCAANAPGTVAVGYFSQWGVSGCNGAVGIGPTTMVAATNCSYSTFVGAGMGAPPLNNAPYCGGFGAYATVPNDSQYRFAYGYQTVNNVTNFSHVFGHLGTNYCAITKDVAAFYVPVTVPAGGDIPMGSFTNSP